MPWIERDSVRLYFEEQGEGLPVVLGHSFLCSGEMWAPQVPVLSREARVVNVDYRGHGQSGAAPGSYLLDDLVADVLAILDHLGIGKAVWAGLSIGGMVALRAALGAPERVAGLVLLDTHAGAERRRTAFKYRAMGLGARLFGLGPFLPPILKLMFGRTTLRERPELVREWKRRLGEVHLPSVLCGLHALIARESVEERLGEIRVPALVMVGQEDVSLPPSCSRRIAAGIGHASLVVIPGAGHLVSLEQPEVVSSAMIDFLAAVRSHDAD